MVLIGSARINEYGTLEGGKAGDQNGKEVAIEPWYLHSKGWYVIRAKDRSVAKLIAKDMKAICENDNIGYSFWYNCYGLYNASKQYGYDASKVKVKCDTNCAKAVWVCVLYAGVYVENFNTGDAVEKFLASGKFNVLKDAEHCNKEDELLTGDILVTRTKGHIVVVVEEDEKEMSDIKWMSSTEYAGIYNVSGGSTHIRKYPSVNSESLGTRSNGYLLLCDGIVAQSEDRVWYHIKEKDLEGFVSGKMLRKG